MSFSYGFYWDYGVGVYRETDGTRYRPGTLMVFDSRDERDKWVNADVFDGNFHRSTIDAKTAKSIMVGAIFDANYPPRYVSRWEHPSDAKHWAPTAETVAAYRSLFD